MTGDQLRQFRESLPPRPVAGQRATRSTHCSQQALAQQLGVSMRTLQRYEWGTVPLPRPIMRLLRGMMRARGYKR